jgi:hypothetical protein
MLRTKLARKVLTKTEQKHLTEIGVNSIQQFQKAIDHQERMHRDAEQKHGKDIPVFLCRCPDCWHIAKKLGVNATK